MGKVKVLECKYCDNSFPPRNYDGDMVCSKCGAELEDAKILVEYDDSEFDDIYISTQFEELVNKNMILSKE